MEIIALLFIIFFAVIFIKILALLFQTSIFILALPFKILGVVLSAIFVLVLLVPLGIIGAIAGLLVAPLVLLFALAPIVLILLGLYLLIKNS
ncbi:MAG: hypothetical protein E4H13_13860 [Calditrichales bacterium]|nr:MAG: hypothetical protein E4H13_13860 [Calditrichales bacterium]